MNSDGVSDKLRLNHQLQDENKAGEGGFKVRDPAGKIKDRLEGALQVPPTALQIPQQQQSQGSIVCWERFLHLRTLKVLLVETDYSTRHVITALLRNCSYEVTEAANGLQAWKILADLNNQIDLVLTEVVMPGLSGIGLLYKIMSHKTRNNVPVIMMSSHDSMGIVFKCLSKGAVDFLVKPIRKNELKNLWQHVWRRCHSSSGSGSESGTQTQKSVKSRSVEKSDNNSGSNDEDDDGSMGLNVGDGSDNGSGTQSSWTKQAIAVNSSRPTSPHDEFAECPDSTCAQVIHSNGEVSGNKKAPLISRKVCEGPEEQLDNATCEDKEKGFVGNVDLQIIHEVEVPMKLAGIKQKHLLEKGSGKVKEQIDKGHLDLNSETPSSTLNNTADLTGSNANIKSSAIEASSRQSKISENKPLNDAKQTTSFEHGLKRIREVKDVGTTVIEDRNVIRRSDSSAFSRYNAPSNANKAPGVNIKNGSPPLDSTSDKTRKGSVCDLQSQSNGDHPNQCSNRGSNNIDMGSTTNHNLPESAVLKKYSTVSSSVKYLHPPSSFQPSKEDASEQILSKKADDAANKKMLAQSRDAFQEHMCQCVTRNCNHHDLLSGNVQQQQQQQCCQPPESPPDLDDTSLKKSNVLDGAVEGTGGNYYSLNRSGSGSNHGSNHGSNGQNGSSTVVNTGGINLESDNGIAGKSGSGDGSGSGSGSGSGNGNRVVDDNKLSQRAAALTKFRQKRNERCFRKKVRYQSRKKLAEQRPRVRGQFVRQTANGSSSKGTES
ncbi:Two-component response regulator-like APRR7 [Euphorbia peplus]|nr:Two-component response regulator-like APRR7 [Euphorbia peplus]